MEKALVGHIVGRYRIERQLGAGGMGEVYLGVQPQIGSQVAIKVLTSESAQDDQLVERFFTEARAVNTIRHDNIVNILDLDRLPDGRPFIVMEFLDGISLSLAIRRRGALPLGGLTRVASDTLEALAAAHRHFIVHRDLKPDNLLVTRSGRTKVLDFGIAKLLGPPGVPSLTQTGMMLGTPHYMAPEQIAAGTIDARTDLYALGVILYEGATGRKPFDGGTLYELFSRHVGEPPRPPSQLCPDLTPAYEAVILRALEKDPARRFGSAKEMHAYLHEAAKGLPPHAQVPVNLLDPVGPTHFVPQEVSSPAAVVAPAASFEATAAQWQGSSATPAAQTVPQRLRAHPDGDGLAERTPLAVSPAAPVVASAPQTSERRGKGKVVAIIVGALVLLVAGGALGVLLLERQRARQAAALAPRAPSSSPTAVTPATPALAPPPAPLPKDDRVAAASAERPTRVAAAPTRPRRRRRSSGGSPPAPVAPRAAPAPAPSSGATAAVHLGPGVQIGGGVKIISETLRASISEPLRGNPRAFDAVAFYPRARELARRVLKDAALHVIHVPNVRADTGLADLLLTSGAEIEYRFRSPLASKLVDETLPSDKRQEAQCMVVVYVRSTKVLVVRRGDSRCNGRLIAPPNARYHPKQAWAVTIKRGDAGKRRVADLMWDHAGWYLSFGSDPGGGTVHKKEM